MKCSRQLVAPSAMATAIVMCYTAVEGAARGRRRVEKAFSTMARTISCVGKPGVRYRNGDQ